MSLALVVDTVAVQVASDDCLDATSTILAPCKCSAMGMRIARRWHLTLVGRERMPHFLGGGCRLAGLALRSQTVGAID